MHVKLAYLQRSWVQTTRQFHDLFSGLFENDVADEFDTNGRLSGFGYETLL